MGDFMKGKLTRSIVCLDTFRHVHLFGKRAKLVTATVEIFIRLKNDRCSSLWKNRPISYPDI